MNSSTRTRPITPATTLLLRESAPRIASTSRRCMRSMVSGRAPDCSWSARSWEDSMVNLPPSMMVVPVVMGALTTGAISSSPSRKMAILSVSCFR